MSHRLRYAVQRVLRFVATVLRSNGDRLDGLADRIRTDAFAEVFRRRASTLQGWDIQVFEEYAPLRDTDYLHGMLPARRGRLRQTLLRDITYDGVECHEVIGGACPSTN